MPSRAIRDALLSVLLLTLLTPVAARADVWHFDDADTNGRWGYDLINNPENPAWEPMFAGALSWFATIPLHPDTSYYAWVDDIPKDYRGWDFGAGLWTTKASAFGTNTVYATLDVYDPTGGGSFTYVGSDSAVSDWQNGASVALIFDLGTPTVDTRNKSFVLTFTFSGTPLDTDIYWDGAGSANSCMYAYPGIQPWDHVVCEYAQGSHPAHPDTYWYDVTPNGVRRDFHVRVFDDDPQNYSNWVEPQGWTHKLHKVTVGTECEWWVSWYDVSGTNPISGSLGPLWPTRFGFNNENKATWGEWITTNGGGDNPHMAGSDSTSRHGPPASDGHGRQVHVPSRSPSVGPPEGPYPVDPGRVGCTAWIGEWSGDELRDMAISGRRYDGRALTTTIFVNEGGTLVPWQEIEGVENSASGSIDWGLCDDDVLLDLAVAGASDTGRIAKVFVNDGGDNFVWNGQILTGVSQASVAWGDYDGDGAQELLVMGYDGTSALTTLYNNDGTGSLTVAQYLQGLYSGSADWCDYDCDGDLDLLITGHDGTTRHTILYENDPEGTLTSAGDLGLPGVALSDVEWGDYDRDGDPDLAFTGEASPTERMARIYENDGSGGLSLVVDLLPIYRSSCAWGDYDLDGDLDIAFCGYTGTSLYTKIYENDEGTFVDTGWSFPGVYKGDLCWIDVDCDCDLDFFILGDDWGTYRGDLYLNERIPTGAHGDDGESFVPPGRLVGHNYPNPFNPRTTIRYKVPVDGQVAVRIYDLEGRVVRTIDERTHDAGEYEVPWDGHDDLGRPVASGVYFYRVEGSTFTDGGKMVLLK